LWDLLCRRGCGLSILDPPRRRQRVVFTGLGLPPSPDDGVEVLADLVPLAPDVLEVLSVRMSSIFSPKKS
jgi:hypothetical protein